MVDTLLDVVPPGKFDSPKKVAAETEQKNKEALDIAEKKMRELGLLKIAQKVAAELPEERHPRLELMIPSHRNQNPHGKGELMPEVRLRVSFDPEPVHPNVPLAPNSLWKGRFIEIRHTELLSEQFLFPGSRETVEVHGSVFSDDRNAVDSFGVKTKRIAISNHNMPGFRTRRKVNNSGINREVVENAMRKGIAESAQVVSGTIGERIDALFTSSSGKMRVRRSLPIPPK